MTAEIIQFVPRPDPKRPTLTETEELQAAEFLLRSQALIGTDCGNLGWPWSEDKAQVLARPSDYSKETTTAICIRLGLGESLREICRDDAMPSKSSVMRWLAEHAEFRDQYASAREAQADYYAEEIIEISDDATNDWMTRNRGEGETEEVENKEVLARSRLRVDTRKWLMARMAPKKYGDKVTQEHLGPDGGPLIVRWQK